VKEAVAAEQVAPAAVALRAAVARWVEHFAGAPCTGLPGRTEMRAANCHHRGGGAARDDATWLPQTFA